MDATPSNLMPQPRLQATISWIVVCIVATTATSLAAAHAPPRVRLIGLFSIAFGLLIGWSVARLASLLEFRPSAPLAGIVAALMTFCGLAGSTWETWRLEESRKSDLANERVAERLVEQLKGQPQPRGTIAIKDSTISGFRWYLSRRIRQLGRWQSPWPELFWGLELTLAATASFLTAFRIQMARRVSSESESSKS